MGGSYEIDMTQGGLLGKILLFSIPLMCSGVLQLVFNAADVIVVGRFAGTLSIAAVGATTAICNLLVNIFVGLSVGVNVLVARNYAAKKEKELKKITHTAICMSVFLGVMLGAAGIIGTGQILSWMGCPEEVKDLAAIYMRIYYGGLPVIALYNFGSAILRAVGDTRRPLIYLFIAGICNVLMNLFFVIVLRLDVAGVALATILAQGISAALVMATLLKGDDVYSIHASALRMDGQAMLEIVKIGLPAGLQGALFSLSNVVIQSSINSFGAVAMAGNAAANSLEGFSFQAMNAFYQACVTFTSQNYGVRNKERVNRVLMICLALVTIVGLTISTLLFNVFAKQLIGIYTKDPEAIVYGVNRVGVILRLHFICGIMDVLCGSVRGLGYSLTPMLVSLLGVCGLRLVWVFGIFRIYHTLFALYLSYPVSWILTGLAHLICFFVYRKKAFSVVAPDYDGV